MIRCNLNILLAKQRMNVAELHRATGVSKKLLHLMHNGTVARVDLDSLEKVCRTLNCSVGDLFEVTDDEGSPSEAS
jgi:putative transcriptional regulator